MKRVLLLLVLLLTMRLAVGQVLRTVYASALSNMPNCTGKDVIVRNYSGHSLLIHHTAEADRHEHHFALQSQTQNNFRELVVTLGGQGQATDTWYDIADIKVLGDTCYFCGTRVADFGAPVLDIWGHVVASQYEKRGFIGRFSIASILDGGYAGFEIYMIGETESLSRLTLRKGLPGDQVRYHVMLSAVGQFRGSDAKSCVLEAANYLEGGWRYSLSVNGSDNDRERFTDIVSTPRWTFVASFYTPDGTDANASGWHMLLHKVEPMGVAEMANGNWNFYDGALYDFGQCGWGWHQADAQCRLALLPRDRIGLSFGTQNSQTQNYGILTASLSDNFILDTVTVVGASHSVQVQDMTYLPFVNQLAVLARDGSYYHGGVFLCPIGYNGSISVLSKVDVQLQSLCRYTSRTVFAGGFHPLTKKICTFWQHPQAFERPSCVTVAQAESALQSFEYGNKYHEAWTCEVYRNQVDWDVQPTSVTDNGYVLECKQNMWFREIDGE